MNNNISEEKNNSGEITPDMLKYVLDNDILNISYIQEQMEMTKRSETLSKHPYAISEGKDGYFRTYLPDPTRKDNRRLIKKKYKKDLEDEVIDYWREKEENPTIEEVFLEANDRRLNLKKISLATHERNEQTFNRFYKKFKEKRIKTVTMEAFEEFLEEAIPEFNLTVKSFSLLKTVTRMFLKRARKRKLIEWTPDLLFQDLDTSESEFKRVIKEDVEEVFNEDEYPLMMQQLETHPDLRNLGIILMFVTGIRVGGTGYSEI